MGVYVVGIVCFILTVCVTADEGCGGKPADVVFVLDTSASIGKKDFPKQVQFTKDVVNIFDIGNNKTRVGVVLFSTDVHPVFGLPEYNSKEEILTAIGNIEHKMGGTNTDKALEYIREKEFKKNARPGIPKIAIILTDGQSYNQTKTVHEAELTQAAGITIFVIGIGRGVDQDELSALASDPDSTYLSRIGNYSALAGIKKKLAIKACKVEYVPPKPKPNINADSPAEAGKCTLNLIMGVDTNGVNSRDTRKILAFVSDVNENLSSRIKKFKTSQIMTECAQSSGRVRSKSYAPLIRKMRYQLPRKTGQSTFAGILFINSDIEDASKSLAEVRRAKFIGFKLFVVKIMSVARNADVQKLLGVQKSSPEYKSSVFEASSYSKLPAILTDLADAMSRGRNCTA